MERGESSGNLKARETGWRVVGVVLAVVMALFMA
jgi:hypothetical protein